MQKNKPFLSLVCVVFLTMLACNLPGTIPQSPAVQDQVEKTVQAQLTVESIAATVDSLQTNPTQEEVIPTETTQPSLTPEPSVTSTPTITVTPTPDVPMVSVSLDTNCRFGPHIVYDYLGALLKGETAEVVGRHTSQAWILINNPDRDGVCWITTAYATIQGDVNKLSIAEAPPFYDWTGNYTLWVSGFAVVVPMNLTQDGVNVGGEIATSGIKTFINGTLSENGEVLSGLITNEFGYEGAFLFKMAENMNQLQGNVTEPGSVEPLCAARNGAGQPSPCMWP
jgi:uncharacterized protein YgiM (DUF1202 family)